MAAPTLSSRPGTVTTANASQPNGLPIGSFARLQPAYANETDEQKLQRFAALRDSSNPHDAEAAMRLSEDLIEQYMPLVGAAMRKWRAKMPGAMTSIGFDDLRAAGAGGLWKALLYFDPARGTPFARFASIHIHGEMNEEVRRADFVQDKVRREIQRSWRAVSSLENRLNREATEEEAARASGVSVERYRNLCLWDRRSLAARLTEPLENYLCGTDTSDPLQRLCAIEEALESLEEDDHRVEQAVREVGIAVENIKGYFEHLEGAA